MSTATSEAKRLFSLALPMVITQVSTMLMGVVDTMMVGHLGVDALGAVSLGHVWLFGTTVLGMGIVMGIDPIVTQAHGARDSRRLGLVLQQGLFVAGLVSIPMAGLWMLTQPMLVAFGQDVDLSRIAETYALVQIPSIPAFFVYFVLRQYLQGRGIVRPAMWIAITANVVNVVANWSLIYGHLGMPVLGVKGAGIATALVRVFMCLGLLFVFLRFRYYRDGWIPWTREAFAFRRLGEVFHYGLPVGLQLGLEIWAFEIATLMSGRLGTVPLNATVIALNLISITFMVPLGISMAATTRVGNLIGENKPRRAQTSAWVAVGMGAGVMVFAGITFALLRHVLPGIYTRDAAVIALAATVLPAAAASQVFDGTQVVALGILRGMGKTRPAAVINGIGFYLLALPLAWWLAFRGGMGVTGIWWGLCLGLASVALMLVAWLWKRGPARIDASVLNLPRQEQPANP